MIATEVGIAYVPSGQAVALSEATAVQVLCRIAANFGLSLKSFESNGYWVNHETKTMLKPQSFA